MFLHNLCTTLGKQYLYYMVYLIIRKKKKRQSVMPIVKTIIAKLTFLMQVGDFISIDPMNMALRVASIFT